MSATLTPPANRAYTLDPIWIGMETDLIDGAAAYFEITISGAGPTIGDTLVLTWPGGTITYTVAAAIDGTGLAWPEKGGSTLEDYTNEIAEFLHHRSDVTETFKITVEDAPGGVIRLTRKVVEVFALSVTDDLDNVAVTATDGTAASSEQNLRAYVEVWTYTGNINNDRLLIALHSPYKVDTAATDMDISAAFAHLTPHLPDPATINPASLPASLPYDQVTDSIEVYIIRAADKYGSPAVSEALGPYGPYVALLGSRSLEAFSADTKKLLHNYRRRDEADFRKPVSRWQPDWVYYFNQTADNVYVTLTIYWSDGTTSTYDPWDTDTVAIADGSTAYWYVSGFRQLDLHNVTPSGGTDPDAHIVAYDWKLKGEAAVLVTVRYDVIYDSEWNNFLLFDNGQGGMETVWLRGKSAQAYIAASEEYQRPRQPDDTVVEGDFGMFAASARQEWEFNTGWYADPFYLEHLRQLPLAHAWLVDRVERRFLKVIVQPGKLEEVNKDDETLYSLSITVRAAWLDVAANI